MSYFVRKTGLPMFDACRAYGLALILDRLVEAVGGIEFVRIEDLGPIYLVKAPEPTSFASVDISGLFDDLLSIADGWCGVLLTTGRTPIEQNLKPKSRAAVEKRIQEVRREIQAPQELLTSFVETEPVQLRTRGGSGYQTLPASLDVSASKGIRRAKRDGYSEGEQICVSTVQWAMGLFGGAHFVRWTWTGDNYTGLLPAPQSVTLHSHRDIRAVADAGALCGVSTITAAAHYAVRLAEAIRRRGTSEVAFGDRYATLVVQAMSYAGNQWKPQSGGFFPLEFPMRLVEKDLTTSAELFNLWDHLFRWGSVRGNENLALTLAEFLGQPSLETFERHIRIHLRMTLADERRRPFAPYQTEWMKEVASNV